MYIPYINKIAKQSSKIISLQTHQKCLLSVLILYALEMPITLMFIIFFLLSVHSAILFLTLNLVFVLVLPLYLLSSPSHMNGFLS